MKLKSNVFCCQMLQQNDHNSVINIVTQTKLQQYDVVMMNSTVKYCTISPVILEEIIQFQSGFALLTTPPPRRDAARNQSK